MARIPEAELERIKREISLERVCMRYGVELKPHGRDLIGLCPFHDDHDPSFVVTPQKNLWHCLGACQAGGSVIDFVMRKEDASFRRAVEILREISGDSPPTERIRTRCGIEHAILTPAGDEVSDSDIMDRVTEFYHRSFLNDPKAMSYLQSRRCLHPEAITTFRLGYANRTLGYSVPCSTNEGRRLKERLISLGVMRSSGHEHMSGSVVIPIMDSGGRTVQMYGRKIIQNLRLGTPKHLYLPGDHKGVWNYAGLIHQREWILCEALIDALTLWSAGFRNVTASYGVNGWTADHRRLLESVNPRRIIICYDNDDAGNSAAENLGRQFAERGIEVIRARLPEGGDVNDVARRNDDATAALSAALECSPSNPRRLLAGDCVDCVDTKAPSHAPVNNNINNLAAIAADGQLPNPAETIPPAAKKNSPGATGDTIIPAEPDDCPIEIIDDEQPTEGEETSCQIPSAQTPPPIPAAPVEKTSDVVLELGDRSYRVRGLGRNLSFEIMKVNIRVMRGEDYHIDTLDLYSARHRQAFVNAASSELAIGVETIRRDLGQLLLHLERMQEQAIAQAIAPTVKPTVELDSCQRAAAMELLTDPRLLDRIAEDFETCGLVGERVNKLLVYLAAVSRKLDEPLAVLIQSTSAAGKTALMEAMLAMLPDDDRVKYSAMTGQALFYLGDLNLKHKVLAIVEEEGAIKASYALKLLQSEGELTIASTGKDPASGRMITQEYRVEGPVMILTTTTAIEIDEELQNRCIVLSVDEGRDQTRAIHRLQRHRYTLEGLCARGRRSDIRRVHRDAQSLLRPLAVVNPYAGHLTFSDDKTRTRRDHQKYLTLIASIALLHQHQRPVKTGMREGRRVEYIEATLEDIATANLLAAEVFGSSLDELAPQTRRFLNMLYQMVQAECSVKGVCHCDYRFTQRQARSFTGWTDMQVKRHMQKLVEMEYILVHRGGRGQSFEYELLYDGQGQDGGRFAMGLLDVDKLRYDADRTANRGHEKTQWGGQKDQWGIGGACQGHIRGGGCADGQTSTLPFIDGHDNDVASENLKNAHLDCKNESNRNRTASSAAI